MEEARFSINIRFSVDGFDSQITVRGDDDATLQAAFGRAMSFLERNHCVAERRWENGKTNGNGNGHANGNGATKVMTAPAPAQTVAPKPEQPARQTSPVTGAKPVCKKCNTNAGMELIEFTDKKTGEPRAAWKCQTCMTWVR